MTVKELIEKLQEFDEKLEIRVVVKYFECAIDTIYLDDFGDLLINLHV